MARIRTIKPEAFEDSKLAKVSHTARWLFAAMWTYADDDGRALYNEKRIEAYAFPYESVNIRGAFGELSQHGFVHLYDVEGDTYFHMPNFRKHQKIDKPKDSKLPDPQTLCPCCSKSDSSNPPRSVADTSENPRRLEREQGTGNREEEGDAHAREESSTTSEAIASLEEKTEPAKLGDEDRALLREAAKGMLFAGEDLPARLAKQIMSRVIGKQRTDQAVHAAWCAMPLSTQAKWAHAAMAIAREDVEQSGWLSYAAGVLIRSLENGSDLLAERKRETEKVTQIADAPSAKKEPVRFAEQPWGLAWERFATGNDRDRVMKLAGRPAAVAGVKGCNVLQALAIFDREGVEAAMAYVWPFWLQEAKQANA